MVDGMGGVHSQHYARFTNFCFTAFSILRQSANLILNLVTHIVCIQIRQRSVNNSINDGWYSRRASYKMARGVASPAPAYLPRVSFVKVVGEDSTTRSGVHDNQQRSYGCVSMCFSLVPGSPAHRSIDNDFSLFERPQHYIRYIGMLGSRSPILKLSSVD